MSTSNLSTSNRLVIAALDEQRFALPLAAVERIVRAVAVTPLPNAPQMVLGVINVQGAIIPVIDMRRQFDLPPREMELSDQIIIARTSRRAVALPVDAVSDVIQYTDQEAIPTAEILPRMEYVEGVIKFEDSLVFIYNLDRLLSLPEDEMLQSVINSR